MKLVYWVVLCAAATPTALWNRVENQHHCYVSGMLEWGLEFQKLPKTLLWDSVKLFWCCWVSDLNSLLSTRSRVLYTQYHFIRNGLKCSPFLIFSIFHLLHSLALHGCFLKFSRFSQWFLKFCKKTTFSKIIISVFSIHILIHQLFLTWFPEGPWNDYTI